MHDQAGTRSVSRRELSACLYMKVFFSLTHLLPALNVADTVSPSSKSLADDIMGIGIWFSRVLWPAGTRFKMCPGPNTVTVAAIRMIHLTSPVWRAVTSSSRAVFDTSLAVHVRYRSICPSYVMLMARVK